VAAISREWEIEIVKRPALRKFVILPKRWVVERTFAWLNRYRRLAKDFENLTRNALAFLRLASICLMLRKLCIMKFRDRLLRCGALLSEELLQALHRDIDDAIIAGDDALGTS
jgi:hypothetical protein